jgi:hypothetical protein
VLGELLLLKQQPMYWGIAMEEHPAIAHLDFGTLQAYILPQMSKHFIVHLVNQSNLRNKHVIRDVMLAKIDFQDHLPFQAVLPELCGSWQQWILGHGGLL